MAGTSNKDHREFIDAWDRLERLAQDLSNHQEYPTPTRDGGYRFVYRFNRGAHFVKVWAIEEKPRYCAVVDGVFSLRCSNATVLRLLIERACERDTPWAGEEIFDTPIGQ